MLWILLSLLVSLLKSLWELAGKIFTNPYSKSSLDEYTLAFWGRILGAIWVFPLMFFIPLFPLSFSFFLILLSSSILNAIATVTAIKAVKYGDLSLVWPLWAFTIPFLVLTGFVIAWEIPNSYGMFWVIFIFIGSYFLQIWEFKKWVFAPITAIYKDTWAKYMLITALIWSITTPLDKLWILEYGVLQWICMLNISIGILMSLYSLFFSKKSFKKICNKQSIKKISLLTLIWWWMLFLQMFALKFTLSLYVIAIKRASGIFSILFWALFFQEKNIIPKLIAVGIMILWVTIISLLGNI